MVPEPWARERTDDLFKLWRRYATPTGGNHTRARCGRAVSRNTVAVERSIDPQQESLRQRSNMSRAPHPIRAVGRTLASAMLVVVGVGPTLVLNTWPRVS